MRYTDGILKITILTSTLAALVTGCASSPGIKEDKAAVEKSKAYLEGLQLVEAGARSARRSTCALLEKSEMPEVSTTGPSKKWREMITRGNTCAGEQKFGTLKMLAQQMSEADIDSPWGPYFLSVAAEGEGDLARALWMIDLAQKKAGGKAGLFYYQRGRVLMQMKETARAVDEIEKAVKLEPTLLAGHLYLAQLHHRDQEWDRAEGYYKKVLAQDTRNYHALVGLAEVRLADDSAKEAVELYTRAIELDESQLGPWLRLGWIYENAQKNNEHALGTYKRLKASLDRGTVKGRPDFDLGAKIKALEETIKAQAARATASTKDSEEKRSVK